MLYKELIPLRNTEENWNRLYDNTNHLYNDYSIVFMNPNTYGKVPNDVKNNLQHAIKGLQRLLDYYGED